MIRQPTKEDDIARRLVDFAANLTVGEFQTTDAICRKVQKGKFTVLKYLETLRNDGYVINRLSDKTTFDYKAHNEFLALPSVQNWLAQLTNSTKEVYGKRLFAFSQWLPSQKFTIELSDGNGGLDPKVVSFANVEELLRAYKAQTTLNGQREFLTVIKRYLVDDKHKGLKLGSMGVVKGAIVSYFKENGFDEFTVKVNFKKKYSDTEQQEPLTPEEFLLFMTKGQLNIRDSAIFMAIFQRAMDESTFCHEFNYKAWPQITKALGHDYKTWDLDKAPIPIWLRRVKTGVMSVGFLDRDALNFMQKYLTYREDKLHDPMREGKPLFVNQRGDPITEISIREQFDSAAIRAGLQKRIEGYERSQRYKWHAHELRDLFRSLCTLAKVSPAYAESFLNHKGHDLGYDKSEYIDLEPYREEYKKVSPYVNIFSMSVNNVKTITELREKLEEELQAERMKNKELQAKLKESMKEEVREQVKLTLQEQIAKLSKPLRAVMDGRESVYMPLEDPEFQQILMKQGVSKEDLDKYIERLRNEE